MKDINSDEEYYDANDQLTMPTPHLNEETSPVKEHQGAGILPKPEGPGGASVATENVTAASHPLSAHIVRRESTRQENGASDQCCSQVNGPPSNGDEPFAPTHDDRPKTATFLSRIGLKKRNTKKDTSKVEHVNDDAASRHSGSSKSLSELYNSTDDIRLDALLRHNSPPPHGATYVKVKKSRRKPIADLTRLVLAQTLASEQEGKNQSHPRQPCDAIWTMKISKDGEYMASGGQRCVVQVWKVLGAGISDAEKKDDSIKVFEETPVNEFKGHTADILDLSWSKNNFLLSSSMDKTVRLWHVSRKECLCVFQHRDFVTSLEFHPKDDRYFLSGSLDCKIRLWSIPDKKVTVWNEVPDDNMVTAVGFTRDAKTICAGTHTGRCFLFETHELKYMTEITGHDYSIRGSRKGRKITGVEAMPGVPPGEEKILVTSNDSKIRLYDLQKTGHSLSFRGVENVSMQIKATFSDDGLRVICGSEDCSVYTWNAQPPSYSPFHHLQESGIRAAAALGHFGNQLMQNTDEQGQPTRLSVWLKRGEQHVLDRFRNRNEHFGAHDNVVTVAIFAPTRTRQYLAQSKRDTIYNHTPRMHADSLAIADQYGGYTFSEGPIIVSSDSRGCIKVWRKDSGVYEAIDSPKKRNNMVKYNTVDANLHRNATPLSSEGNHRMSDLFSVRRSR